MNCDRCRVNFAPDLGEMCEECNGVFCPRCVKEYMVKCHYQCCKDHVCLRCWTDPD